MLQQMQNESVEYLANSAVVTNFPNTVTLHLYKSSFVPGRGNTLADFLANEIAFTGYGAITMTGTWSVGFDDAGQVIAEYSLQPQFAQTAPTASDVCGGWFIVDAMAATLLASAPLDAPFPFNKTGNKLAVRPSLQFILSGDAAVATLIGP